MIERVEGSKSQQSMRISTQTPETHYGHHWPPGWMLLPQIVCNILISFKKSFYKNNSFSSLLLFVAGGGCGLVRIIRR